MRGQLYYTGDELTDRLIFDRLRSDEYNNYSGVFAPNFPTYANGSPVNITAGSKSSGFIETIGYRLGALPTTFDPYSPQLTNLRNLDQRTTGLSNEINRQWGEDTFTSIAAWREFTLHPRNADNSTWGNGLDIQSTGYDVYVDQYSLENRLASAKDETLEWTIGSYLLKEQVDSQNRQFNGPQAASWFLNKPGTSPALLWGTTSHQNGIARTFSAAAFAQTSWHLDEQWTLTTGLRNTYEIREGSDFGWVNGNTTAPGIAAVQTSLGGYSFYDTGGQTQRTNSLSGLINPSYRFNENILAYTSAARGEKSGAVNTNALPLLNSAGGFLGFQPVITHPEVSWDYELGVKTNWFDNRLIVNLNVFWNDIYDFQSVLVNAGYLDVTGVPLRKTYLGNIPQVRARGFRVRYALEPDRTVVDQLLRPGHGPALRQFPTGRALERLALARRFEHQRNCRAALRQSLGPAHHVGRERQRPFLTLLVQHRRELRASARSGAEQFWLRASGYRLRLRQPLLVLS